jgi:ABC-type transporter MlaC component
MKKITLVFGLVLALVAPSAAGAKPVPDKGDKRAAKQECKTLRGHSKATREAFRTQYRSFAACVKDKAAEEAQEEQTAHRNASRECRSERMLDKQAFAEKYGTNVNKRNAFGKCVSQKARAMEAEADEQDQEEAVAFKNAAKECAAERETLGEDAFREQYGTNANKRNAFGKCVSQHAREDEPEPSPEG